MTRETKVGLVVAGSFLCLVGAVLALKLKQAEDPLDAQKIAEATPPAPVPSTDKGTLKAPASAKPKKADPPGPNSPADPPPTFPPVVQTGAKQLEQPPIVNPGVSLPQPPAPPISPPGGIITPPENGGVKPTKVDVPPQPKIDLPAPVIPEVAKTSDQQTEHHLQAEKLKSETASPAVVPAPPPVVPQATTPLPPAPVTEPAPKPPAVPENNNGGVPLLPPPNPMGPAPVVPPPVISPAPVGNDNLPLPPPTGTNPAMPLPQGNPPAPVAPPIPAPMNPVVPEIKGNISLAPADPVPPPVIPPKEASQLPAPPPAGPPTKIDPPAPVAVSVSPPRPAEAPQVRVTETKIHVIEAKDKTFADLSSRFYGTPEHAEALLKFNRDYPMAGDAVKQNPPVLQPGQRVFIPDVATLKQGTATPTTQITPAPAVPPVAVPPVSVPVSPLPPPAPAPGGGVSTTSNLRPVASTGGKAEGKMYQVASGGEMLLSIAERTLGNRDRWSEIYRLNPQFPPQYPIPAGTVLRMPQ